MIYEPKLLVAYTLLLVTASLILFISSSNFPIAFATHLELNTTKLTDSMYVIYGSGGNVILSIGNDGIILVDDQYAPVTEKMKSVIANITNKPIKFVINTHWHPDHVGGKKELDLIY